MWHFVGFPSTVTVVCAISTGCMLDFFILLNSNRFSSRDINMVTVAGSRLATVATFQPPQFPLFEWLADDDDGVGDGAGDDDEV